MINAAHWLRLLPYKFYVSCAIRACTSDRLHPHNMSLPNKAHQIQSVPHIPFSSWWFIPRTTKKTGSSECSELPDQVNDLD